MALGASERILSIQSHVVSGYVGNKAAVFPLQRLGYDVDVVNTVQFSNHNGYGRPPGGTKATAVELNAVFEAMEANELMRPTRLLTGYVPGAEGLSTVAKLAERLKKERPNLIYLLDPVIGDAGRLYVSPDVIPVYRKLLPLATIISPNWFEVEILTDIQLHDLPSLRQAIQVLHEQYHVPNVVISSLPLYTWLLDALPDALKPADADHILCLTSSSSKDFPSIVHAHCVQKIPGYASGVGDLFSALLVGHFQPRPAVPLPSAVPDGVITSETDIQTPISSAASHALAVTHHLLRKTYEHSLTLPEADRLPTDDEEDAREPMRRVRRMRGRELRLVQNQDALTGAGLHITKLKLWSGFWE